MTRMLEGLKTIYSGNNALNKHVQLFSLCGITAILAGYLSLVNQGINEIKHFEKGIIIIVQIIFLLFFTGFETKFLHQKSLPEIDMSSFKIALKKIPFLVFFVGLIFLLITDFNSAYQYFLLSMEIIIGVPLTMLQAGYAQNFENNDFKKYFQKFRVKEYFFLLIKRIWIIFSGYVITLMITFFIFFITGLIGCNRKRCKRRGFSFRCYVYYKQSNLNHQTLNLCFNHFTYIYIINRCSCLGLRINEYI